MRVSSILSKFIYLTLLSATCLMSCQDIKRPSPFMLLAFLAGGSTTQIGVVTTDFGASGRFRILNPSTQIVNPSFTPIYGDAIARFQNSTVYVVNRLGSDSIQVLNPQFGFQTQLQFSLGSGSNPHDFLALSDTKSFVTLYNEKSMWIGNQQLGTNTGYIDLSSYAEKTSAGGTPDGLPEMNYMSEYNGKVYVQLQRLDRNDPSGLYAPNANAYLLEVDGQSNQVTGKFIFPFRNPFSKMQTIYLNGADHLICAAPAFMGYLSKLDGGVVAFNLQTKQFDSQALYLETTAGGDIVDVVIKNPTSGFASVLFSDFRKEIHEFNPQTGQKLSTLISLPASTGYLSGMLLDKDGELYIGNASTQDPGIWIFDTNSNNRSLTPSPIQTQFKPMDLVEIE